MANRIAALALLGSLSLALAPEAAALDPYMWGVGPRVGTMVIPGRFPLQFPKYVRENSTIDRVRGDVFFGVDSVYYANGHSRVGAFAGLGLGRQYFDANLQFEYNYVLSAAALDFLFGGGVGFGTYKFGGEGDEQLVVPYYPLRVETSGLLRDNSRAYQLTLFGQLSVPSNHFYRDFNGQSVDDVGGGLYATLGIEVSVMFGDFTPPRPRGRRGT